MQAGLFQLMADAGLPVRAGSRDYRPTIPLPDVEAKILKPQTIVEMLHLGRRDLGFAGADWVAELLRCRWLAVSMLRKADDAAHDRDRGASLDPDRERAAACAGAARGRRWGR